MSKTLYGSIVWLISAFFVIYVFCLSTATTVVISEIKTAFMATDVQISCAVGAFVIGFACLQIPAGYLLDRFNARLIVASAVLVVLLGNLLMAMATNIYIFTLANFIQGLGAAFDFLAASILIAQWFTTRMFPILTGLLESSAFVFAAVMHYFFVVELERYSWQAIYQALAVFGVILLLLTIFLIKTPPYHRFAPAYSLKRTLKVVCSNKQIWLCTLAAGTSFGVLLAYADMWYAKVQEFYAVEHRDMAIIGGMFFLGIASGPPLLGWISNQCKSRKLVLHLSLVIGNMVLLLALYSPHLAIETLIPIKIISFLTGFALSGSMLFYTMVSELANNHTRGVALSVINTGVFLFNSLMLLIPYLAITYISKQFFTYLWVLPFFILIAIALLYFIKETYADERVDQSNYLTLAPYNVDQ